MNKNVKFIEDWLELPSHPVRGNHAEISGIAYKTYRAGASSLDKAWSIISESLPLFTEDKSIIYWRIYPQISYNQEKGFFIYFRMLICKAVDKNISHPPHRRPS